jgi:hypothetical protein
MNGLYSSVLIQRFPYLDADEWEQLLKEVRRHPLKCQAWMRDELIRLAFRTRPSGDPTDAAQEYGYWVVFVLATLWPLQARLARTPRVKTIANLLTRKTAIGVLLYGSEAEFDRLLRHSNLKPKGARPPWPAHQQALLDTLAYTSSRSQDPQRSFVRHWLRAGQQAFITRVIPGVRPSREPYPPQDLARGERRLERHHTVRALVYLAMVEAGIHWLQSVLSLSPQFLFVVRVAPVVILSATFFIWGFPPLLPRVVDFLQRRR